MYALLLNDMRQPNIENLEVVTVADGKEILIAIYKGQLADKPYTDGKWGKVFKQGGPFEWYNPINDLGKLNDFWGGIWEVDDSIQVGERLVKAPR